MNDCQRVPIPKGSAHEKRREASHTKLTNTKPLKRRTTMAFLEVCDMFGVAAAEGQASWTQGSTETVGSLEAPQSVLPFSTQSHARFHR